MRPPLNAEEYADFLVLLPERAIGFNEASAECGGILDRSNAYAEQLRASMRPPLNAEEYNVDKEEILRLLNASMRPPLNAEEYDKRWTIPSQQFPCFNEASAECGGIRLPIADVAITCSCFNEASAECGGILVGGSVLEPAVDIASMRPPLNAEEYVKPEALGHSVIQASMRPPLNAEEYSPLSMS